MFDSLRDRSSPAVVWTVRIVLTLIAMTFAVWGVESYFTSSAVTEGVASVNGAKITQQEFAEALRNQQELVRERSQSPVDSQVFRSPEFKQSVLDVMINRKLLTRDAHKIKMTISDAQLAERIHALPVFQVDGKFSKEVFESQARNRGYSPVGMEEVLREDFAVQDYFESMAGTAVIPQVAVERFIKITEQQREVSIASVKPDQFLAGITIAPAQTKKYYDANLDEFRIAEQAKVEYVVFSAQKLAEGIEVKPEEISALYKEREAEFIQKEQRQASHILITVDPKAPDADKAAARKKAEGLLAQVKADPAKFPELAKANSQDPASAAEGGKLDFVTKEGLFTAPFEGALFKMQKGEIVGPVETEFGYHIIKLDELNPQRGKSLAEVSEELKQQIQKRKAGREFAEKAEMFGDLVYDQSKGIKGAADALKLEVKQSDWISRGAAGTDPTLGNPKLQDAIFSPSSLKDKRTTEPVEVAPNVLVAARVIESKPASTKPYDAVATEIADKLKREEAGNQAVKKGEALLAELKAGKAATDLTWTKASLVSRQNFGDISPVFMKSAFAADTIKLPSYAGQIDPAGGYAIIRVGKVVEVDKIDDLRRAPAKARLGDVYRSATEAATLSSLRARGKISVNAEALIEKEQ